MKVLRAGADVDAFFRALAAAGNRVLMTDFDGTIAPFDADRERARPYPGVVEALRRVRVATRLVVVSGRVAADVAARLDLVPRPEIWGLHGRERWPENGPPWMPPLEDAARNALDRAAAAVAGRGWDGAVERKPAGLALHWRGRDVEVVAGMSETVRREWVRLAREGGLELHEFDGGMELRVAGTAKANAVQAVCEEAGSAAVVAYLGDDATDESAFEAVRGHGLAVLVRPDLRPTGADAWIRPPDELLAFLERWIETCPEGKDG